MKKEKVDEALIAETEKRRRAALFARTVQSFEIARSVIDTILLSAENTIQVKRLDKILLPYAVNHIV